MSLLNWLKNLFVTKTEPTKPEQPVKPKLTYQKRAKKAETPKPTKSNFSMDKVKTIRNFRSLTQAERHAIAKTIDTFGGDAKTIGQMHDLHYVQACTVVRNAGIDPEWVNTYELTQSCTTDGAMMLFFFYNRLHNYTDVGSFFGLTGNQVKNAIKLLSTQDKAKATHWLEFPADSLIDFHEYKTWVRGLTEDEKNRLKFLSRTSLVGLSSLKSLKEFSALPKPTFVNRLANALLPVLFGDKHGKA